jgi:hypothetical protein
VLVATLGRALLVSSPLGLFAPPSEVSHFAIVRHGVSSRGGAFVSPPFGGPVSRRCDTGCCRSVVSSFLPRWGEYRRRRGGGLQSLSPAGLVAPSVSGWRRCHLPQRPQSTIDGQQFHRLPSHPTGFVATRRATLSVRSPGRQDHRLPRALGRFDSVLPWIEAFGGGNGGSWFLPPFGGSTADEGFLIAPARSSPIVRSMKPSSRRGGGLRSLAPLRLVAPSASLHSAPPPTGRTRIAPG